jgi:NADH:ubiquinone oxidoreductase subunit C
MDSDPIRHTEHSQRRPVSRTKHSIRTLATLLPGVIQHVSNRCATLIVEVYLSDVYPVLLFVRLSGTFRLVCLTDLTVVDFANFSARIYHRFCAIYNLTSVLWASRLMVSMLVTHMLFTASRLYHSAHWLEREVWDFFGIFFVYHSDLRRLLTDYGFAGHALLKDFPLCGFIDVRFSESFNRVVYDAIELRTEYRRFLLNLVLH